ncbi:C-GCAxxG-C-C family (seleno)protein [Marinifilum flexuosum]|uniref:Putative redox-active protein with C_GCAxxG_C_C motif n=1 Tax=Marinifilum flexuosum TaxID=1117708 RepID=A0A419X310_9BACT|nr:C-GCAxxG-C-C family (seleno)protein [Marinifilum flexuosum]RKE02000.1 putative redox-active protein with C_GCAxxG_C_C motif [Marinifilum flexuosum]
MSFFHKRTKADTALKYFHKPPGYYNCAQAIFKAFQEEYQITNDQIVELSKYGNGKAPNGYCGAYFAALELIKDKPELKDEFTKRFQEKSDHLTCFDIRFNYTMSCKNLVKLAANLLNEIDSEKKDSE